MLTKIFASLFIYGGLLFFKTAQWFDPVFCSKAGVKMLRRKDSVDEDAVDEDSVDEETQESDEEHDESENESSEFPREYIKSFMLKMSPIDRKLFVEMSTKNGEEQIAGIRLGINTVDEVYVELCNEVAAKNG